tara:strand:+ start:61 stop:270 length:210 start_codon:yes stop_codon:yes gene_type:complete
MSVTKKELIEECAELRVAKSDLEDIIKRLHSTLSEIDDDPREIGLARCLRFRSALSLAEFGVELYKDKK